MCTTRIPPTRSKTHDAIMGDLNLENYFRNDDHERTYFMDEGDYYMEGGDYDWDKEWKGREWTMITTGRIYSSARPANDGLAKVDMDSFGCPRNNKLRKLLQKRGIIPKREIDSPFNGIYNQLWDNG